jgi:hypothetical protein
MMIVTTALRYVMRSAIRRDIHQRKGGGKLGQCRCERHCVMRRFGPAWRWRRRVLIAYLALHSRHTL